MEETTETQDEALDVTADASSEQSDEDLGDGALNAYLKKA